MLMALLLAAVIPFQGREAFVVSSTSAAQTVGICDLV